MDRHWVDFSVAFIAPNHTLCLGTVKRKSDFECRCSRSVDISGGAAVHRAAMKSNHTLHAHQGHLGWNNANPSVCASHRTRPSSSIRWMRQAARSHGLESEDLAHLDFDKVNPVTGPVYIEGAEPGDAIKVTMLEFTASGWGWTGKYPGFGLLADQFKEPHLHIWKYDVASMAPAMYGPGGRVPLKPFCGTIGLAPAEPGQHSVVPPRRVGGNMDIRDLSAGAELYLPVEVKGGLFSVGDTHAAQGDGEVCGTAIESPIAAALKFDLIKSANLPFPRYTTAGPGQPLSRCRRVRGHHRHRSRFDGRSESGSFGHDRFVIETLQDERHRCVFALLGMRRSSDQRDCRYAELGGRVLFSSRGVRFSRPERSHAFSRYLTSVRILRGVSSLHE